MSHTVDYSREKDRPQIRPHPCPKSPYRHIRRRACRAHPSHYQIICYERHIKTPRRREEHEVIERFQNPVWAYRLPERPVQRFQCWSVK